MNGNRWGRTLILSLLMLGVAAGSAQAEGYGRAGGYIGGGYTYAAHLFEGKLNDLTPDLEIDLSNSSGFHFYGGYRVLPFLAFEGEYEQVAGFQGTVEGFDLLKVKGRSFTGNLRLIAPIYRIQPFFVIGLGTTKYTLEEDVTGAGLSFDDSAFAIRLKGGVETYITKHFAVSGAFGGTITTHDLSNPTSLDSLSGMHYLALQVGAVIRF